MVRRKFLRYTRAEHLDEEGIQRYIRFLPPDELYHHLERFPQLDAISLFGNERPLEMEVGCGSAEPLCALAKAHPERAYVGIDISGPSIHKAAENATMLNLENILFLHADMHLLYPLLAPQAVQAVYLHFPDPHAKSGYKKRRVFGKHFLDAMVYTLKPEGILSVMTDHQELFLDMLAVLEADPRFAKAHTERYLLDFEHEVKSHFQRIWEQHGERVFRFVAYLLPASVEEKEVEQIEEQGYNTMETQEMLTPQRATWLLERQKALQNGAEEVLEALKLPMLLEKIGQTRQLGSSTLGLMVWRDIDLSVSCPPGTELQRILQEAMLPIFCHPSVALVRFLNQTGNFREEGDDPRYYFPVHYRLPEGEEWKIDISFWLDTFERPETVHDVIAPKITENHRLTILWIKDLWYRLPSYRTQVYSVDIYDAVMNHEVRTPGEFDVYLRARGKPGWN